MFIKIITMQNKDWRLQWEHSSHERLDFFPPFSKFQSQEYFIKAHTIVFAELRTVLLLLLCTPSVHHTSLRSSAMHALGWHWCNQLHYQVQDKMKDEKFFCCGQIKFTEPVLKPRTSGYQHITNHWLVASSSWKPSCYLSIIIYIITQVILTFWLVLAYDLLEDRCMIDVIVTELLPLPF